MRAELECLDCDGLVPALGRLGVPWQLTRFDESEVTAEFGAGMLDVVRSAAGSRLFVRAWHAGRAGCVTATPGAVPAGELAAAALDLARHGARDEAPPVLSEACVPPDAGRPAADAELGALRASLARLQRDARLLVHGTARVHDLRVRQAAGDWQVLGFGQRVCHAGLVVEGWDDPSLRFQWTHWGSSLELGPEAAEWFAMASAWQDLPARQADAGGELLLAPPAVHALLSPLVAVLAGTVVAPGGWLPRGAGGPAVLDRRLSVSDDLDEPGWPRRPPADDEGVAPVPARLIGEGRVAGLFHTRASAAAAGVSPTGHGFRGTALSRKPLQPVAPAVSNIRLSAGTGSVAGLVAAMRSGVIVESLVGANQGSPPGPVVQGRIRLGFVVDRGRVVARLAGLPVSWDVRELLGRRLAAVSACTWPAGRAWTGRLPFILVGRAR
jgi:PmbA protein